MVNISQQEVGYIVSHWNYGNSSYLNSINKTLTLTGVMSRQVQIYADSFTVQGPITDTDTSKDYCYDYLFVDQFGAFCGYYESFYLLTTIDYAEHEIIFTFNTDSRNTAPGFMLRYRGMQLTVLIRFCINIVLNIIKLC